MGGDRRAQALAQTLWHVHHERMDQCASVCVRWRSMHKGRGSRTLRRSRDSETEVEESFGDQAPDVSSNGCFLRDQPWRTMHHMLHAEPQRDADVSWAAKQVLRALQRRGH